MPLELIATSTMGLEAVVARELEALGYQPKIIETGRVLFQGDETAIARANLWLRAAGRVLLRVGHFEATDFGQLFDGTRQLPWERWIAPRARFPVSGRSRKSKLSSVPACQRIVKKAIADRLMDARGVSQLDEAEPDCHVEVMLLRDEATLTLDTSGSGLHKRGYRRLVGKAPLRETLAAAMILLSFWKPDRPLLDPFCGSGTIPIEAAMIGRQIAPGLHRQFAAEAWPTISPTVWAAAREEARDRMLPSLPERIQGTDIDDESLSLARHHAEAAQVAGDIHFQNRAFESLSSKRLYGCMITNPPYAQRMGATDRVGELYRLMPEILRRLPTWSHYIITAYPDFEGLVGQQADRRRKLYNSRIECTYYQFHGPRPPKTVGAPDSPPDTVDPPSEPADTSPEAAKSALADNPVVPKPESVKQAFGGLTAKAQDQAAIFANRLAKRARHLRRWPTKQGITCFRLYDRDIPEVPLVVDRYESLVHISEYERPHDRTPAEHADWLDLMKKTAADVLEVPKRDVYLKRRRRQRGNLQHQRIDQENRTAIVHEGGLRFEVNLSDYIDTGLFLDHRITRGLVRDAAHGRRVLNLFGYTGSFTVYAVDGKAASTLTVDLSSTYLDWARRNLALNGLERPEDQLIAADVPDFVASLPRCPQFDLAIVDPPTFSNSKRTEADWDVQRDHGALLDEVLARMAPDAIVFFSTNFRRFKLDEERLDSHDVREISRQTVPPDFRNRRVHRCWRIRKES